MAMVGWAEFEQMETGERLSLVRDLELKCVKQSKDLVEYSVLVGKVLGLLSETTRREEPEAFRKVVECESLRVPDSELCPEMHYALERSMARKAACKADKVYSRRHRCNRCHDPMRFENEHLVTRCADEATKIRLVCDRCGTKVTF